MTRLNGAILGYDPGGNGRHGMARLVVRDGTMVSCEARTADDVESAIGWFDHGPVAVGIGVDGLTAWGTGRSGLRPADRWLKETYPTVGASIVTPNALYGSMVASGMALVLVLLDKWGELIVSETHPKVLYYALTDRRYEWGESPTSMSEALSGWMGVAAHAANDHEWDALASAYAVCQGMSGKWTRDLHALPTETTERLICPVANNHYFWPS